MLKRKTISVIAMILAMTMLVGIVPFGAFAAEDRAAGAVEAEENVLHNAVQSSAPEDVETAQESETMPEDGDLDSNDAALDGEAVVSAPVLQPAVPFAANLEKQNPEKEPICEYEFAEGVIEIPLGTDVEIADENDGFVITIKDYKVEIPIGSTIAVYVNYIAYVFEAELVEYRNGSIIVHAHKRPDDAILSAKVAYSRRVSADELIINTEPETIVMENGETVEIQTLVIETPSDYTESVTKKIGDIEVTAKIENLVLDIGADIGWDFWNAEYHAVLRGDISLDIGMSDEQELKEWWKHVENPSKTEFTLFSFSPSGTRIDTLAVNLDIEGSVSLGSTVHFEIGCEKKKDTPLQGINIQQLEDFHAQLNASVMMNIKGSICVEKIISLELALGVGISANLQAQYHPNHDETHPGVCVSFSGQPVARGSLTFEVLFLGESYSLTFLDRALTEEPLQFHIEDGALVEKCTYKSNPDDEPGQDDEPVEPNTPQEPPEIIFEGDYENNQLIDTSEYEPTPIWGYEPNDDGENTITITKYLGGASALTIPDRIALKKGYFSEDGENEENDGYDRYYVTRIGDDAFKYNTNLRQVIIPGATEYYDESGNLIDKTPGIMSIGKYAFQGCTSLETINLPETLEVICEKAFASCSSLKDIYLPDNISEIHGGVFEHCYNLSRIVLPKNLARLDNSVFSGCNKLEYAFIPKRLCNENGTSYFSTSCGPFGTIENLNTVEFEDGVEIIPEHLFLGCRGLKNGIVIPSTVKTIKDQAFQNTGLTSVVLPDALESIGKSAFAGSQVETIKLPKNLTSLAYNAFGSCPNLKSVEIPKSLCDANGVSYYADAFTCNGPFACCENLDTVVFEEGITCIPRGLFYNCNGLKNGLLIPETVTAIKECAFRNCSELPTVDLPAQLVVIENNAFEGCSAITEINFPTTLTNIKGYAFRDCVGLTSVTLPPNLVELAYSFRGCTNLEYVFIPKSLCDANGSSLYTNDFSGSGPFGYCNNLKTVEFGKDEDGNGITCIPDALFAHCTGPLLNFKIPDTVTQINDYAFAGCEFSEIRLPNTLESIGAWAFQGCASLKSVDFPESLASIGFESFIDCVSLEELELPTNLTYVDSWAFDNCKNLKSVWIPKSLCDKGVVRVMYDTWGGPFENCDQLSQVTFEEGTTIIPVRMFVNCPGPLDEITIPDTVNLIDYKAFYGCSKLTSIKLNNGLVTLGNGAFANCSLLTNITIPKTVTKIDDNAFTNHEQITVCGIAGSYAETYANNHGMQFAPIPDITEQPKSASVAIGKTVSFKVAADGENLRYQWQYKKVGETSWTDWTGKTAASLSFKGTKTNNGCQYRCVVSNEAGSVTSSAATLTVITVAKPAITKQPESASILLGETVTFSVAATGENLRYQWQYKKPDGISWVNWSNKTSDTASVKAKSSNNGYLYRCVVSNEAGAVYSEPATLNAIARPVITSQPTSASVALGETASFTVVATGDELNYQWQYLRPNTDKWVDWSGKTSASVTVKATNVNNGYQYRCIVSNEVDTVYSDIASLTVVVAARPVITTQPENASVMLGETASFTVVATGDELNYQWQYLRPNTDKWVDWSGKTAASATVKATNVNNGYQYRCVVSNIAGSVASEAATLSLASEAATLAITAQPESVEVALGQTATFTVVATGENLSYQWQYKKVGQSDWTDWAGKTTASLTVKGTSTNNGCQYRCVVSNDMGSVPSAVATLTVISSGKNVIFTVA